MTKTGTTLLQNHLFANHSQVDYRGKFNSTGNGHPARYYRDAVTQSVLAPVLEPGSALADASRRRLVGGNWAGPRPGATVSVFSAEELSKGPADLHRARAENLCAVFGRCRILITLRHPLRHVESEYCQSLKSAVKHKRPRLLDIDARLRRIWSHGEQDDLSKLRYAKLVEAYSRALGKDSIGVFLYEELREDPRRYVQRVCEFLGIAFDEAWRLCEGRRANDRWTQEQADRLLRIDGSSWRRELFRRLPLGCRRMWLGLSPRTGEPWRPGPPARVDVPHRWQTQIEDLTRAGNRWLRDEWNLPLERYGYPL
jgi:hypothetical protein